MGALKKSDLRIIGGAQTHPVTRLQWWRAAGKGTVVLIFQAADANS